MPFSMAAGVSGFSDASGLWELAAQVDSLLTQDLLCSWSVAFGLVLLLTAGYLLTS